jgi:hypothetical protein
MVPGIFVGVGTVLMRSTIAAGASNPTYLTEQLAHWAFGEWSPLRFPATVSGTLLMCIGATLVSLAK